MQNTNRRTPASENVRFIQRAFHINTKTAKVWNFIAIAVAVIAVFSIPNTAVGMFGLAEPGEVQGMQAAASTVAYSVAFGLSVLVFKASSWADENNL